MTQATFTGPVDHPLTEADRVSIIETTPSNWTHDDSDTCPCSGCETHIRLGDGDYTVVTLTEDRGKYKDKTLHRFCDAECYGSWAQAARESGGGVQTPPLESGLTTLHAEYRRLSLNPGGDGIR